MAYLSNLPPGCRVCDIPGCTPEDDAWVMYWEGGTRPEGVWLEVHPDQPVPGDMFDEYEKDAEYHKAIDKDFIAYQTDNQPDYPREDE
jgi:hypothetical protein